MTRVGRVATLAMLAAAGGCIYSDAGDMRTIKRLADATEKECKADASDKDKELRVSLRCRELFGQLKQVIDEH